MSKNRFQPSTTHLSTESTEESIPKMAQREREVLVEEISKEFAHSVVAPSSVNEEEPLQISKLGDGVITC